MMADERMKKGSKIYFVYLAIIVLQVLNLIYWANVKVNYHIDELFSMGYANSYTEDVNPYITSTEDWRFNEWLNNAELQKYLWISEGKEIYSMPLGQAIIKLTTASDNHSGLLNLAESLSGYDTVSKWPGIFLNIFIFIVAELVLIALAGRLKLSKWATALFLILFGFCGYTIGLVEFIRFYMLVVLMAFVMIFFHSVIWTSDRTWQIVVCEIGSFAMACLGLNNSELMLVYSGALMGCFFIALLLTKQRKKLGMYAVMLCAAVIYLACKTDWLDVLFHVGYYAETGGDKLSKVTTNIVDMSGGSIAGQLKQCKTWLYNLYVSYYFGYKWILTLWAVVFYTWFVLRFFGQKTKKAAAEKEAVLPRRIVESCRSGIKRIKALSWSHETGFVFVLAGTYVIYTVFFAVAMKNLWESRYYAIGFITCIIVLWYAADRIMRMVSAGRKIYYCGVLTGLTVISCLAPFYTRNIQYIYEQDTELISSLQDYQGMDVVIEPYKSAEDKTLTTTAYDCITLMNGETRIYPIEMAEYTYESGDFPDEFIFWTYVERNFDELISSLEADGYQVECLGTDHASKVYICDKL